MEPPSADQPTTSWSSYAKMSNIPARALQGSCRRLEPASAASPKKKKQIGDHALPQRGFGLGTPEGAEGEGATPGNTG
jgi:hypothetical protein